MVRLGDPSPVVRLRALVDEAGAEGLDAPALRSLTGLEPVETARLLEPVVRSGGIVSLPAASTRYVTSKAWSDLADQVRATLAEFHKKEPLKEGFPREELRARLFGHLHPDIFRFMTADLSARGIARIDKDRIALATHSVTLSPQEQGLLERIEARYAASGTNPPELEEVIAGLRADASQARRLFHLLLLRGRLVKIPDGKVFHARALEELKRRLWDQRSRAPVIDISEFKELSGTSRKNAIPLLEHFDQTRITRREGNKRLILPPPRDP